MAPRVSSRKLDEERKTAKEEFLVRLRSELPRWREGKFKEYFGNGRVMEASVERLVVEFPHAREAQRAAMYELPLLRAAGGREVEVVGEDFRRRLEAGLMG